MFATIPTTGYICSDSDLGGVFMVKSLYLKEQVELCEHYEDRFSISELAIIYDISEYQVKSVLEKYNVPERTEPL